MLKKAVLFAAFLLLGVAMLSLPPGAAAQTKLNVPARHRITSPNPLNPCCGVTAFNAHTGVLTVKEFATGHVFTLKIAHFDPVDGARLAKEFKAGTKIGFQPVDGARLKQGSKVRLSVHGFDPVDSVVSHIATH